MGDRSGEGSTPFTGLAQAPEANLFTGALGTSIPIKLPPGRGHTTPKLALQYSSGGGPSPFGHGWDLPMGRIQRSTRWGVPRCSGPSADAFVLVLPEGAVELVADPPGSNTYRPLVEDRYLKVVKHPELNSWVAWDGTGTLYEFGLSPASRTGNDISTFMESTSAECKYTSTWGLSRIVDPNGNATAISYAFFFDGSLYPSRIDYGGNAAVGQAGFYSVLFDYEIRPDTPSTAIAGHLARLTRRLSRIRVQLDDSEIRRYELHYDAIPGNQNGYRSMLNSVSLVGFPTQTFQYADSIPGHQPTPIAKPAAVPRLRENLSKNDIHRADTRQSLFDMNGDGFVDIVRSIGGSWQYYPGLPNGFGDVQEWTPPPDLPSPPIRDVHIPGQCHRGSQWTCTARDTFDITGDGIPDRIDARQTPWKVYEGLVTTAGGGFKSSAINWDAPDITVRQERYVETSDFSGISTEYRDAIDMNGDGRPDFVVADPPAGTCPTLRWAVYLNDGTGFVGAREDEFPECWPAPRGYLRRAEVGQEPATFEVVFDDLIDFNGDGLPDFLTVDYVEDPGELRESAVQRRRVRGAMPRRRVQYRQRLRAPGRAGAFAVANEGRSPLLRSGPRSLHADRLPGRKRRRPSGSRHGAAWGQPIRRPALESPSQHRWQFGALGRGSSARA
jgi:hypothetical protein